MNFVFDKLRSQIEKLAGDESYLVSFSFFRLNQELDYEKKQKDPKLKPAEQKRILKKIEETLDAKLNWSLQTELISWIAAILRDVSHEFIISWHNKLKNHLLIEVSKESDQKAIEQYCQELGLDTNQTYQNLAKILDCGEEMAINCNNIITEAINWHNFKDKQRLKTNNIFIRQRLKDEKQSLVLTKHIQTLLNAFWTIRRFKELKDESSRSFWQNSSLELLAVVKFLDGLLDYKLNFAENLDFLVWLKLTFPEKLAGKQNPFIKTASFNKIIIKLKQATYCLYDHLLKNESSFDVKNKIINKHIRIQAKNMTQKMVSVS